MSHSLIIILNNYNKLLISFPAFQIIILITEFSNNLIMNC